MYNLIDLIQLKHNDLKRDDIENILTSATKIILETLEAGKGVQWVGLGMFTWKQKAKTKKAAQQWTEYPYMAEGKKTRFVPEQNEINLSGPVTKMKRELPAEVVDAIEELEKKS